MKDASVSSLSRAIRFLKRRLELPEMRDAPLDSPATTVLRLSIIQGKPFLRRLYCEWYSRFREAAQVVPEGPSVELGSGAGFIKEFLPNTITSEVLALRHVDSVFSAEAMPFNEASLSAVYLLDVFHHLSHPARFLREAARCLKPGGRVVMIEPYNTWFGRQIWTRFHHEPFEPDGGWDHQGNGPLSDANGAAAWIIFERDRALFERTCPEFRLLPIRPLMPLAYVLSGGVSMRGLLPGWCYPLCRQAESICAPIERRTGMFAEIHLLRI